MPCKKVYTIKYYYSAHGEKTKPLSAVWLWRIYIELEPISAVYFFEFSTWHLSIMLVAGYAYTATATFIHTFLLRIGMRTWRPGEELVICSAALLYGESPR